MIVTAAVLNRALGQIVHQFMVYVGDLMIPWIVPDLIIVQVDAVTEGNVGHVLMV
ncbi:MAG: hypothetical protein UV68_C0006G0032 [Candidatus Collierbacteria bacterium GW2011_GWC2_43_12]|uniref:Uncharacterized protein n=1 Tax=Candidatus Collierbacteria bacterium GW2011_GWC2_43_12 TaxID=1618390 RepID=A0A0G1FHV2_9BACT|nr:MAG: hypothetical protein UV68_C0006G0032 [Candidatus Collierbacteria bacterium GW2011_GWC2_43_12]